MADSAVAARIACSGPVLARDGGPLAIEVSSLGGVARVRVSGNLDVMTALHLHEALTVELIRHPVRLQVDLSGISFIDARGLRPLLSARLSGRAVHTPVELVAASGPVLRLLTLLDLDLDLDLDDDLDLDAAAG